MSYSKLLNSLFLIQGVNKQLSILLGYDTTFQALTTISLLSLAWTTQLWQSKRRMHLPALAPSPCGASVPRGHGMTSCVGRVYLSQTTQHVSVCHRLQDSWGRGACCFVGQRWVCAFLP